MIDLPLLYHTHHAQESDDLPFWRHQAERHGAPILELGCGTGRVLLPLAKAGHSIFGVDKDSAMLAFLRPQLDDQLSRRVTLIHGDFRLFCLTSRFQLAIMPCNTYSTQALPDRKGVLSRVRLHLKTGGSFVFSLPNPLLLNEIETSDEMEIETHFEHPLSGNPVQVSSRVARGQGTVTFHWIYDHLYPDGLSERQRMSAKHYLQPMEAIYENLADAGFQVLEQYGDFHGRPYHTAADHLIIVAQAHTKN